MPLIPWVWAAGFLLVTLLFGAFTAGLNAADVSSTWPNFHPGQFTPNGLCDGAEPWRLACWFNSQRGVHFVHRNLALIAAVLIVYAAFRTLMLTNAPAPRRLAVLGLALVLVQVGLGIWLVTTGGLIGDPTFAKQTLAVLHQVGALALFAVTLTALYGRS